ncbi:hypothetical protein, partial [Vibrio vulnificus]
WFFENVNKEQKTIIQEEFYEFCTLHNKIIYFMPWFCATYVEHLIAVLENERTYQIEENKFLKAMFPRLDSFKMEN